MYVILWRVLVTILAVEKQQGFSFFFNIYHKRHDFRENIEHKLCVLIFSKTFVCNISHSMQNSDIYYHKCT